jgi:hypothetical protein
MPNDAVKRRFRVEVKTTRTRRWMHTGAAELDVSLRYKVDAIQPARSRRPTEITEILIAELTVEDFRRNERSGWERARLTEQRGAGKLRTNWVFERQRRQHRNGG